MCRKAIAHSNYALALAGNNESELDKRRSARIHEFYGSLAQMEKR